MSTPPLSRSDSRSSLEDSSESEAQALKKPANSKSANTPTGSAAKPSVPSTSNRTLKRTGTWSVGYMPKDKGETSSSDPLLSPRASDRPKPKAALLPSSSHTASSSSALAAPSVPAVPTVPSAPAPLSTTALPSGTKAPPPTESNRVSASDLSPKVLSYLNVTIQGDISLTPERIGELLLAVETKGGKLKLGGDSINRILRGALIVRDFEPASGTNRRDVNVIEKICEPFMFRHLDTPELDKIRKRFVSDFRKISKQFGDLSKQIPQKQWTKSSLMKDLMDPIMQPVISVICGKANSLDSSALPEQVKQLLLSIDKQVIAHFEANGTGKSADLLSARKSALIGFLSTRSLGYVWMVKTREEKTIKDADLIKLIGYMNSYVSNQIDEFVVNILLAQKDQPSEARRYIEILTRKSTLISKPSVPKLSLTLGSPLAGEKVLSARGGSISSARELSAEQLKSEKAAQKKEKEALMKMRLERARFVDKMAKESGLDKIDHNFYQYVKEIVVKMSRRGFDLFKADPVNSWIKYADKYYGKIENHRQVKAGLPVKVRNALDAYRLKLIGNPFAEEVQPVASSSAKSSSNAAREEESSATEPSDESEVRTESSENEKQS